MEYIETPINYHCFNHKSILFIQQMKFILLAMLLVALTFAQSQELRDCIEAKCPEQFKKCKATSGCEAKLEKCAAKCGEKIAQTCWTLCLGVPGAAADVCVCAANAKCLGSASKLDVVGLNLMAAVSAYLEQ